MTAATLKDVLQPAIAGHYAVAGLVVLGWEDAEAYVAAAEDAQRPLILQAGPGCRKHTPVSVLGRMFRHLADHAKVPVVCHIDHGLHYDEFAEAVDHGFTSLMIDGSALPLGDNIALTQKVVALARRYGLSVEGEVGAVGYEGRGGSTMTSPEEAQRFERETGIDALAISVGNVHLQTSHAAVIDRDLLRHIEAVTTVPLVLHGGSGILPAERRRLAQDTRVKKFNIGTELRQEFGRSLRAHLDAHPTEFDRLKILNGTIEPVRKLAAKIIRDLGP